MSDNAILDIQGLSKVYNDGFKALDDVTLQVKKGEIFCLLGANGAGKTTLIGCVTGLVQPTDGNIRVGGYDAWKEYRQARLLLSLVPQEIALDIFITVEKTLEIARGLSGKARDKGLEDQVLDDIGLIDKKQVQAQKLSGGMKRRLSIGKALMNEPELLFLDEPTAGVDVELRRSMWEMVDRLKQKGTTIFLTTHYLEEAERYADRIGFIAHGTLYFVKKKQNLLDEYPGMSLEDIYVELTKKYE